MTLLLIIGVIILIILLILFNKRRCSENPKTIWTYWNEDPLPDFISSCIDTWRKENPEYKVNIVTNENLESFVGFKEAHAIKNWKYNDSHQRMSDLVRLSVLPKFGGIWLDASIICYESLDWVFAENSKPKVYSIPELSTPDDPLIESWFIACKPGDPFVTKWNEEFRRVDQYETIDEYVKDVNVSMKGIDFPNYLLVYVCAKKVYKDLGSNSVEILNASEGPYNYHLKGGVASMCERKKTRLIKFRKEDRAGLDDRLKTCAFDKTISQSN